MAFRYGIDVTDVAFDIQGEGARHSWPAFLQKLLLHKLEGTEMSALLKQYKLIAD